MESAKTLHLRRKMEYKLTYTEYENKNSNHTEYNQYIGISR